MTMGLVEVERKVRQLDHEVQSIYTMLSAIQGTQERHTNRLGELAVKLDTLETKVETLDGKVDTLDTKVDSLDGTLDTVLALLRRDTRE
ncbi:MAG: hypothetical protein M3445_03210 [Actinomycetota bacterium]|nr:hypothetical protein [Actinomycetota bacterium]